MKREWDFCWKLRSSVSIEFSCATPVFYPHSYYDYEFLAPLSPPQFLFHVRSPYDWVPTLFGFSPRPAPLKINRFLRCQIPLENRTVFFPARWPVCGSEKNDGITSLSTYPQENNAILTIYFHKPSLGLLETHQNTRPAVSEVWASWRGPGAEGLILHLPKLSPVKVQPTFVDTEYARGLTRHPELWENVWAMYAAMLATLWQFLGIKWGIFP